MYSLALNMSGYGLIMLLASLVLAPIAQAGDPDILTDFLFVSANQTVADANFFTNTGFRGVAEGVTPATMKITKATSAEFPALSGQSVSMAVIQYPPLSVNPLHMHPRGAELLYVLRGSLDVGFVDTTNKLFTQKLKKGDIFVFPKGLVHFQHNSNMKNHAVAISALSSANAGTISLPGTLFATGIKDSVLARSFKTDVATIVKMKAGLVPKA